MSRIADRVALGSLVVVAAVSAAVHDRLPPMVATHFDLHGVANGFTPRTVAAFLMPALGVVLWAFLRSLPLVLPRSDQRRLGGDVVPFVAALTAVFLSVLHVVVLAVSLVPGFPVLGPMWLAIGALYVVLGLVMPRVRRNPLIGIRTPWTLASDENWARTHRVAGYTMTAAGAVAALSGLLAGPLSGALAITSLLAGAIIPSVYSLRLARRMDPR